MEEWVRQFKAAEDDKLDMRPSEKAETMHSERIIEDIKSDHRKESVTSP